MKENLKKQLLILVLLLAMAAIIFICVFSLVVDIYWLLKIFIVLATLALTFYIFVVIKKINKTLIYIEKEDAVVEEKIDTAPNKKRLLCPKCYHPYDGEVCFVCGFNRSENNA